MDNGHRHIHTAIYALASTVTTRKTTRHSFLNIFTIGYKQKFAVIVIKLPSKTRFHGFTKKIYVIVVVLLKECDRRSFRIDFIIIKDYLRLK